MKKLTVMLCAFLMLGAMGFAQGTGEAGPAKSNLRVGMVTDSGTIDDKSFNQGTWEGIVRAAADYGLTTKYLKPSGTTEADYLKEIGNLVDAGYNMVICPGFKFETSLYEAQDKFPKVKFVILDGEPHTADYQTFRIEKNVVAVYWAEQESGFLAGLAASLQMKEAEFGFVGGMEIPAVQKFNWGFQQGIKYANANYGTKIVLKQENDLYQGSFDNISAGQQIAASMYDKGVNVIFAAAGGVGVGVINEAKNRVAAGKKVWVIGVDVDQYSEGVMPSGKSVILTSAMKYLDRASYDMITAELNGSFPGGQILRLNATNDGIGIPVENPNLSKEVVSEVADVYAKMKSGGISVAASADGLYK
ncbi:BMP family ABC transporter substrate-binding protein [uncultured Sphaerochaeta sp.]|uniref:BMP family lipoprotein n=1 Tax=uncultured Sphaerochaeta sp. TaxID=886478 RepID=UPI002A0A6CA7|nr:BMP family ABC transporter substrate-binding protein [uncultured Sphaerochaeta sp.]